MPNKRNALVTSGELLTFSTGDYSDYSVHGVFKALKDFDLAVVMREFLQHMLESPGDYSGFYLEEIREWLAYEHQSTGPYLGNEADFLAWLARSGYIEDVPSRELHIGSYGRLYIRAYE